MIPDVEPNKSIVSCYLSYSIVGANSGVERKVELVRRNLVRLIDKSVYEYRIARDAMVNEIEKSNGGIIYTCTITNHLENCINSIKRSLNLFKYIKRNKNCPKINRTLIKKIEALENKMGDIRNTIEHIEGKIQEDKIESTQSVALRLTEDYKTIKIGEYSIGLFELVNLMDNLQEIGLIIATHKVTQK